MQLLLEKMGKDLQDKSDVEAELRDVNEVLAKAEKVAETAVQAEKEAEDLKGVLAGKEEALNDALGNIAAIRDRLNEVSALAGLPPPTDIVTGITKSLFKAFTNSKDEAEADTIAKSASSIAARLDTALATRRWDLDNATHGGKLEARITAEVAALREQRDEVRSLENQASDAEDDLSSAQASFTLTETELKVRRYMLDR